MMNVAFRSQVAPTSVFAAASIVAAYAMRSECEGRKEDCPKLIFLGSGSSTGCPKPICTMVFEQDIEGLTPEQKSFRSQLAPTCKVSNLAIQGDPKNNKDYRNNPSFLIHHYEENGKATNTAKNVIIDVGKTFREGALRWFPHHQIYSLDAIVLTHHHMDAAAGLDDVRGFQKVEGMDRLLRKDDISGRPKRISIPLYLSRFCYADLSERFPWLLPKSNIPYLPTNTDSSVVVKRDVASFDVHCFDDLRPFDAIGLDIIPLPILHGEDLISHGFAFSVRGKNGKKTNVVYLSDISRMIPETMEFIQQKLPPTDILIVDALLWHKENPVHFSLDQAMELKDKIQPKRMTYLVGMNCDSFLPHDEMNKLLEETFGSVRLAHDGLSIDLE
jgi:phosphoribosyl 1,2-cyclic phosphodiesterase